MPTFVKCYILREKVKILNSVLQKNVVFLLKNRHFRQNRVTSSKLQGPVPDPGEG